MVLIERLPAVNVPPEMLISPSYPPAPTFRIPDRVNKPPLTLTVALLPHIPVIKSLVFNCPPLTTLNPAAMEIYNCPTVVLPAVLTTGLAKGEPGLITALPAPPDDGNPPVQLAGFDQSVLVPPFQYTSARDDSGNTANMAIVAIVNVAILRIILFFIRLFSGFGSLFVPVLLAGAHAITWAGRHKCTAYVGNLSHVIPPR